MAKGNDIVSDFIGGVQDCGEALNEKFNVVCNVAQFAGDQLRDEFLAKNIRGSGKQSLLDDTKNLYLDMRGKGLLDGEVPDLKFKDFSEGRHSKGTFENNIFSSKNADYGTLMVGRVEKDAILQKTNIGGKVIEYSDDNNKATIIEPRQGGYLMLDKEQNTFTIVNPKGEKSVEKLSENPALAKKATELMDKLYNASDFNIHWTKGSKFNYTVCAKD